MRSIKTFGAILLYLLLLPLPLIAQDQIQLDSSAEIRVPANQVRFVITITATDETPASAFQKHKHQEAFLADLIRREGLSEQLLSFEPVTLQRRQVRERTEFQTHQQVQLQLDSLGLFEEIQMLLADHQFEQFQASFTADNLEEAREQALINALEKAQQRAEIIAGAMGRNLGQVHRVHHSTESGSSPQYRMEALMMDSGSMMDFDPTVPVRASVSITYLLQ